MPVIPPARPVTGRTQILADSTFPAGRSSYSRSNTNSVTRQCRQCRLRLARASRTGRRPRRPGGYYGRCGRIPRTEPAGRPRAGPAAAWLSGTGRTEKAQFRLRRQQAQYPPW